MKSQANPKPTDAPAIVVFGRDEAGKPHASSFTEAEAKLAEKAADFMNLRVLRVRTNEHRALATKVPKGRVFASGKAFVPFVKAALFLDLQSAALNGTGKPKLLTGPTSGKADQPSPATPERAPSSKKPSQSNGSTPVQQPCGWADIQVGAIVLAMLDSDSDWY